jgi:hypothetical protein
MNEGLDDVHEFRVKTRSSPSVVEFGLAIEQMELAQALEAGQGHERMRLHKTVKEQLEQQKPRRVFFRFVEGKAQGGSVEPERR